MQLSDAAREARNAYHREWRRKNPDKVREYIRRWRKNNPEKVREINRRYWEKRAAEERNKASS